MTEKRSSILKRIKQETQQTVEQDCSTYKNENVIFKIQTPKSEQNYKAANFPAKLSIKISNEPVSHSPSHKNKERAFSILRQNNKPQLQGMLSQRQVSNIDISRYQRQIRNALDAKRKSEMFARDLEQTCIQYEKKNHDLQDLMDKLNAKIKTLEQKLQIKQRNESENLENCFSHKKINDQFNSKIKCLEIQLKRQIQNSNKKEAEYKNQVSKLESKIISLQELVCEKQQVIKNMSKFNNQITKNMLEGQILFSNSQAKQAQRLIKSISKHKSKGQNIKLARTKQVQQKTQNKQWIQKCEKMSGKINQLQKKIQSLQLDLGKSFRFNQTLCSKNQQLTKMIELLQQSYDKQNEKQTVQTFKRTKRSSVYSDKQIAIYQGTVKVKMEQLLKQKDKRIDTLQNQIMQVKKQNTILKTKVYQLDYFYAQDRQQDDCYSNQMSLKKAKSLQKIYKNKQTKPCKLSNVVDQKQNQGVYLYKDLMSQCNNLTETLGTFIETCKTQRVGVSETNDYNNQRMSQREPHMNSNEHPSEKIMKISWLNQVPQTNQKYNRREPSGDLQNIKWNTIRSGQHRRQYSSLVPKQQDLNIPRFQYVQRRVQKANRPQNTKQNIYYK